MEYITEIIDKLSFHSEHAYLMNEYIIELIRECITIYATVMDTNFVTVTEHRTK